MPKYADIVLPLALPPLTYEVEEGMELCEGEAVAVPMGQSVASFYTGIVWRLHDKRPDYKVVRCVAKRLYDRVLLSDKQRKFWDWMADYYLCTVGDVMRVALPSMVKASGIDEQEIIIKEKKTLKKKMSKEVEIESDFNLPTLTQHQKEALENIELGHETKLCTLLHGVTGSGKTEVYIHLIAKALSNGKDVLMLVPEIALTTQLIERMKLILGHVSLHITRNWHPDAEQIAL